MDMRRIGAVILAGGAATRFGGRDKPAATLSGTPLLDRVLTAVDGARVRIVVGPPRAGLPADVRCVREDPPGAGPAAAAAAGLAALVAADPAASEPGTGSPAGGPAAGSPAGGVVDSLAAGGVVDPVEFVALLAADLPYLTGAAVEALVEAVDGGSADGAVYLDEAGRRQLLCGVWRTAALVGALAALGDPAGRSMRSLLGGLDVVECRSPVSATPPWYDCDTEEDLRRAQQAENAREGR